ncbi:hypothetical protein FOZ63_025157 [Perkinsus olseni]|nr:hypothetical protein FOZ63_025157 [Perkinsus olseni]KAF4723373.1 hypothetical protein FOZ62_019468 [Perkinsus olseni]
MPLEDPINDISDDDLRRRYRFSKGSLRTLLGILDLKDHGKHHHVMTKLLVALRYLSNGCFQLASGDMLNCSQEYVSRSVAEVIDAIVVRRNFFIRFPCDEAICRGLEEVDPRLPGCIGLIDGTHVLLKDVVPLAERADFVDSKRHISLNVQAVLGANEKWISVNTSNPGSAHDSRVYIASLLSRRVRALPEGYWICGDSGYGLSRHLFTPFNDPDPGSAEASFNVAHKSVRSAIERRFRSLKRSWAICNGNLRLKPAAKSAKAVLACFCLHNFQHAMGEPEPLDDEDEGEIEDALDMVEPPVGVEAIEGLEDRSAYVRAHFA